MSNTDDPDADQPSTAATCDPKPWHLYEVLTEREAADFLRRDVHTLRRWRRIGDGPHFVKNRPGRSGSVTYRVEALRDWLKRREVASTWQAADAERQLSGEGGGGVTPQLLGPKRSPQHSQGGELKLLILKGLIGRDAGI
jgi:hypothetical protein